MANQLDEVNGPVSEEGRDVNVIQKQIPIKVGTGSKVFEILLWVFGLIPGLVFMCLKIKAGNYLRGLEQKIQRDASQIDNYLEQRVVILSNVAPLLEKAIDLDKSTYTQIAGLRSGVNPEAAGDRNAVQAQVDEAYNKINIAFERYPELQAHQEIKEAMQQNSYLQREITAAREVYNDDVNRWNNDINAWPVKMIVAARAGYTTRIPFATSQETKQKARGTFF